MALRSARERRKMCMLSRVIREMETSTAACDASSH